MTPKEAKSKALELYASARFLLSLPGAPLGDKKDEIAKEFCLLIAEEVMNERFSHRQVATVYNNDRLKFWKDVKKEIENL